MRTSAKKSAFTLVEMLAVVLVIGILVAIIVGVAGNVIQRANREKTKQTMRVISNAISAYYDENKAYPPDLATLASSAKAAAILSALPPGPPFMDGFGTAMQYYPSGGAGNCPYLESAGPDGSFTAAADNIRSDNN
jgi:prepilin-type N-terminal cleavage/methylation domain-containing protein